MSRIRDFYNFEKELSDINVYLPNNKNRSTTTPQWLHFGGGNLYRAFHAKIAQELLNQGHLSTGIIVGETFDEEVINKAYQEFENNILQVIMYENGQLEKNLLNSTAESYFVQPSSSGYKHFLKYFTSKDLQLLTLTITEKGYNIVNVRNDFLPIIEQDILEGPSKATHTMSIITALLLERFLANAAPIAMVSTDNFSKNGEKFKSSILSIAKKWVKNKFATTDFIDYLTDETKVSFPWTMIDRITPNPSEGVAAKLRAEGIEDAITIRTSLGTNIASFANTEVVNYLVVEDNFPNGRPKLDKAGIILTTRETVDKADAMKVTTCLNPLHTALAIFGPLLGYTSIAEEMKNEDLVSLIKGIGYIEGLPVVEDPTIINPKEFLDQVLTKRLPNPMIPDTPQRIAADTSQKLSIRFGETIRKYMESTEHSTAELVYIPLAIAGWFRYLIGVDDQGNAIELSPDPLLDDLKEQLAPIALGQTNGLAEVLQPILSNEKIFGVDLYQAGLAEKIIGYTEELLAGPGAIRTTLKKYTRGE